MLDDVKTEWLRGLLGRHGAVAGTVHVVAGDLLHLTAAVNIPPKVQEITATIPNGKGMAGLAWQRAQPVQTCDLQTDATGDVRPGAKAVDAKAAVALPLTGGDGAIRAVVGLAWMDDRVLAPDVLAAIAADASSLPQ
jgi:hypothetical protein